MKIEIKPLEPPLLDDYLDFFDRVAFADHPEWAWCYCTYYHLGKEDEKELERESGEGFSRETLRKIAVGLIERKRLRGYLAYAEGEVVGWCNAGDKSGFKKLCENAELWDEGESLRIKAVVCFIVAPGMRRRGVAKALLSRVLEDAASEGYQAAEAYPADGERDCFEHYHGHPAMYEALGFTRVKDCGWYSVYRKTLA